ncbi:uncharacterized protein LOC123008797 [Tribolium madens]|uniref:uncharacterized protein LOC123008797 n=1 Tax=Tribolium madens TaxID=41895 RepID=UPI001CF72919|nr:uncharacterized protein LOC123008797 [Tribolium madens]
MDEISKIKTGDDTGGLETQLSIEKACEEYTKSVKLALNLVNHQLENAFLKNCNGLEELAVKIAARTSFLEKNPSFLSCLMYNKNDVKNSPLMEFDEVRITLKEHAKRINEKLDEIERFHKKLFDLVISGGRDPKLINEFKKLKTVKEPEDEFQDCLEKIESKTSLQKVTIQANALSESPSVEPPLKFPIFTDIQPEVQRGKPQQDLHDKLMQQLVASDSLEGFIKLMKRKPEEKRRTRSKKNQELEEKYAGSLWFFPQKPNKTQSAKSTKKHESLAGSNCCSLLVTSSQPCPVNNQDRTGKIRQNLVRPKLKCYDLLDDIDRNDVQPIKSEYPRRDNIGSMKLKEAKSYLHRMMDENDTVWKKLLTPTEIRERKRKLSQISQQKARNVKNLIEYLTAPEHKYLTHVPQSLIVMPIKVIYDNFPTKEKSESPRTNIIVTDLTKPAERKSELPKIPDCPRGGGKPELAKIPECPRTVPFPPERKQEMLDQLRGLKLRNDNIQKNIQKAIDVIETKMIDLLSSPTDASSSEAFCAMEQEITNVLKMMNESQREEPEKDEANRPKLKRMVTTVKREGGDQELKKKTEVKRDKVKLVKSARDEETRKAANIEEGERLLGQVDSVIKKIDSIYTKFYDDSRTKNKKAETGVSNVLEFFDGLKQIIEPPPTVINYVSYEDIPKVYACASWYYQPIIECDTRLLLPPPQIEEIQVEERETTYEIHGCDKDNKRHEYTLNAFYTLFFSGIFVALNLDYAV